KTFCPHTVPSPNRALTVPSLATMAKPRAAALLLLKVLPTAVSFIVGTSLRPAGFAANTKLSPDEPLFEKLLEETARFASVPPVLTMRTLLANELLTATLLNCVGCDASPVNSFNKMPASADECPLP